MSKYLEQRDTATRMIRDKGTVVTISRAVMDYNPADPAVDETIIIRGSCHGVTLPASKGTIQGFDDRLRSLAAAGKLRYWMIADAKFDPAPDDVFTDGLGTLWTVVGATRLSPDDDTPIYHKLGVTAGASFPASPKTITLDWWHNAAALAHVIDNARGPQ